MSAVSPSAVASSLELLRETFEGPAGPSTYFIDNDPKAGFFGALDAVTAAEASRPTRPGGPTVAGHVFHAGFHLDMSSAWLNGDRADRDWAKSWELGSVDDAAWADLRRQFRGQYDALCRTVAKEPAGGGEGFFTILGALAHAAYHLGAVKQALAAETGRSRLALKHSTVILRSGATLRMTAKEIFPGIDRLAALTN